MRQEDLRDRLPLLPPASRSKGPRRTRIPITACFSDLFAVCHPDYNGERRAPPTLENFDKYYKAGADGYVDLWVSEQELAQEDEVVVDLALFRSWSQNVSFNGARLLQQWLTEARQRGQTGADWDLARRRISEIYRDSGADSAAVHARGAPFIHATWIATLLMKDADPEVTDANAFTQTVCDEFLAERCVDTCERPMVDSGAQPADRTGDPRKWMRDHARELLRAAGAADEDLEDPGEAEHEGAATMDEDGLTEGQLRRAPRVDPPEKGSILSEDTPHMVTAAFIKIFQEGKGCPFSTNEHVPFRDWVRHVLLWHDGRGLRCKRFRYWALNTMLRKEAFDTRRAFFKQTPGAKDLDIEDLQNESTRSLVSKMLGTQANIKGTLAERLQMRGDLSAFTDQLEWETAVKGDNDGRGRLPAALITFTSAIYHWERLNRLIRRFYGQPEVVSGETEAETRERMFKDAVEHPHLVEWYVSLKLELMLHLARRILRTTGQRASPDDPDLDEFWATYEWSAGGTTHLHILAYLIGSPRIEKVVRPDDKGNVPGAPGSRSRMKVHLSLPARRPSHHQGLRASCLLMRPSFAVGTRTPFSSRRRSTPWGPSTPR